MNNRRLPRVYSPESQTFIKIDPEEWDAILRGARAKLHAYRGWPIGHDLFEQMLRITAETALVVFNAAAESKKTGVRE
jgi:hypothetical protein